MAPRKHYTISQKLAMVQCFENEQCNSNKPMRQVAMGLGVDPSQLRRWVSQKKALEEMRKKKTTKKSVHPGRASCLGLVEEPLLWFILETREQGLPVSIRMVITKACQLDPDFRRKTERAKDQAIRRFVSSHGIVHRIHTHQSQRSIEEVRMQASDWIVQARLRLFGRDPDFVLNMDQTPIFFSSIPKNTLETAGARTVNIRTSTTSTMRVSVAVTVTASGRKLPSMFVFKGKKGGRIQCEFGTYPAGAAYTVQEKAWMDEGVMHDWIERVLKPYVETAPAGVQPILFLDSYRCHLMASVVNAAGDLGVQVEHIPGGCTGLCQPVDVGINKPLKSRVRNQWEDWMVDQGDNVAKYNPPSRETVANWVVSALEDIPSNIIQNSWRHEPYSFFP